MSTATKRKTPIASSEAINTVLQKAQSAKDALKKASAAAENDTTFLDQPYYFGNVDPSTGVQVTQSKGGGFDIGFISTIAKKVPGKKNRESAITTPELTVVPGSNLNGCGNFGLVTQSVTYKHGNCKYGLWATVDGFEWEGAEGVQLVARGQAFFKWVFTVSQTIMGQVFDAAPVGWELPINRAKDDARIRLLRKYPKANDDVVELQALEAKDEAIKDEVNARAREMFIKNAEKNLPCKPIRDEKNPSVILAYSDFHSHRRVWGWVDFGDDDKKKVVDGPSAKSCPPTPENWGKLLEEMCNLKRVYQYGGEYVDVTTQQVIPYPPLQIDKVVSAEAEKRMVERVMVPNPFFNPLLVRKTKKGDKLLHSLVQFKFQLRVKRGLDTNIDGYGVVADYFPRITIIDQRERIPDAVINKNINAKGVLVFDDDDDVTGQADEEKKEEAKEEEEKTNGAEADAVEHADKKSRTENDEDDEKTDEYVPPPNEEPAGDDFVTDD